MRNERSVDFEVLVVGGPPPPLMWGDTATLDGRPTLGGHVSRASTSPEISNKVAKWGHHYSPPLG